MMMMAQCSSCRNCCCSIPPPMDRVLSTSSQRCGHGDFVSNLRLRGRSQTDVERLQLLRKNHDSILQQLPVGSKKRASRFRVSAVVGLGSTGMVMKEVVQKLDSAAASSAGQAIQTLKTAAQLLDPSSPTSPARAVTTTVTFTSPEEVTTVGLQDVSWLGATTNLSAPSIPNSTTQTAADGLEAAGEAYHGSAQSIDSFHQQLSNNNIPDSLAGAGKAAANMLEETKATIADTVTAAQDSVARSLTNIQEITMDSGVSVGNALKDVYKGFAGAGKAAANILEETKTSITNSVTAAQDSVTSSFTNIQAIRRYSGDSVGSAVKDVNEGFAGAGKASKAAANILEETKTSITDSVTVAQDSVTRTLTNIQEIAQDSGNSVGNALKNVYKDFAGAGKAATNLLEETKSSITDTVTSAKDSVTRNFTNVQEITKDSGDSVGNSVKDVYEGFAGAGKAAANTLQATKTSITDTVTAAQDSVTRSFTNIQEITRDSVDSVGHAVKDVHKGFNSDVKGAIDGVTSFYDKTIGDLQSTVDNTVTKAEGSVTDFTSAFRMHTPVNSDAFKDIAVTVRRATGSALEASASAVAEFYASTKILLPTDVQLALSIVEQTIHDLSAPVGNSLHQVLVGINNVERAAGVNPENPIVLVLLVVGGTLCIGLSYWQVRYGGYSGDLIPTSALDLLKKDGNAVLVDLRSQAEREKEGVPDLRRGARSRSATVEVFKVEGSLQNQLRNPKETNTVITAAIIHNLKNVKPSTKVIVMDEDGSQSKAVARALHQFGIKRRYRIDGGFRAWNAAGLRTKAEGTETPISILKEDTQEFIDEVQPTADGVFLLCMGITAGLYAAIEWEKTLQLIGVIGISQVIYSRAKAYDSKEDVKADFRLLQRPFLLAIQGFLSMIGQAEPRRLQLATSPSTSAVRERVVQAAAKHGPLASEDEPELESEPGSEQESQLESLPYAMQAGPEVLSPPSLRK